MTYRLVVSCDGTPAERSTIPLDRCRAFATFTPAPVREQAEAILAAGYVAAGSGRHLCPGCARAAAEHPATEGQP